MGVSVISLYRPSACSHHNQSLFLPLSPTLSLAFCQHYDLQYFLKSCSMMPLTLVFFIWFLCLLKVFCTFPWLLKLSSSVKNFTGILTCDNSESVDCFEWYGYVDIRCNPFTEEIFLSLHLQLLSCFLVITVEVFYFLCTHRNSLSFWIFVNEVAFNIFLSKLVTNV